MSGDKKETGKEQRTASSFTMNLKEIKELIDLITEKGISEFELERAGVRLKISRNSLSSRAREAVVGSSNSHSGIPAFFPPVPPAGESASPADNEAMAVSVAEELHVVRSPMVGTFYSAASPEEPPFVQVGDRVQAGQVLCIIEAMKLMNEIEAEIAGEVLKCYVSEGQPVEYGEPLFDLRPSAPATKRR